MWPLAGDLGLETLKDVEPGREQGAGEEGGQGVVKPLDQAPVPHTGRCRQDGPHPLGGLVNTQPPQYRLLVSSVSGQARQAVLTQNLHHLETYTFKERD